MAVQVRYYCDNNDEKYALVSSFKKRVSIFIIDGDDEQEIYLDIPTAIKLAKAIRTEIAKIKE